MRGRICLLAGLLALGSQPAPSAAQQQPVAAAPGAAAGTSVDASIAFRFGTLGFGAEAAKLLTGHLAARVGASFFNVSRSQSQSNITYTATLKLHGVSALIDLYVHRRGTFHVTGGIITNPLTISATGQPSGSGTFTINGLSYTAAQVGTLTGEGKFPSVSPYVGLGFGTPAAAHGALKLVFDLGAVLGKPTVSLVATGAANSPQLAADLQVQRDKTEHDVRKYLKVYPVLAFGLAYRF